MTAVLKTAIDHNLFSLRELAGDNTFTPIIKRRVAIEKKKKKNFFHENNRLSTIQLPADRNLLQIKSKRNGNTPHLIL